MAKKKSTRRGRPPARQAATGPLPLEKVRLGRLPGVGEVWQADFPQTPEDVPLVQGKGRLWVVLVTSETAQLVRAVQVVEEQPSPDHLWDVLAEAMQQPLAGNPGRPMALHVRPGPAWDALTPHLAEAGVRIEPQRELGFLDAVFGDMLRSLAPPPPPEVTPLLEVPGVGVPEAASLFAAAAAYYRAAPWAAIDVESAVEIECPALGDGPWYAVVMGQGGMTFGLAIYEDLDWLEHVWSGEVDEAEQMQGTVATALTYGPRGSLPKEDVAAIKKHGFEIAGPKAYPEVYRSEGAMVMRTPNAVELRVLDACLRAVPAFVKKRSQDDEAEERIEVPLPGGPVTLTLSWVPSEA